MNTNTLPSPKTKNNQDQDSIDRSKISWLKHYRNRIIRFTVRVGWWGLYAILPWMMWKWLLIDTGILGEWSIGIPSVFLVFRIMTTNGLHYTDYETKTREWLEAEYPLKWKVDTWFFL